MLTKNEKERLTIAEREYWKTESMVKHCVNKTALIMDLRGKIVPIEKHNVETNFCFGYSLHIPNDFEETNELAEHCGDSVHYFLTENHKRAGYAETIETLNDKRYVAYARPEYCGKCETLYCINFIEIYKRESIPENAFILTEEEVNEYKRKLASAAILHHKKLAAYLKRYGLTKINTWTYWQDE